MTIIVSKFLANTNVATCKEADVWNTIGRFYQFCNTKQNAALAWAVYLMHITLANTFGIKKLSRLLQEVKKNLSNKKYVTEQESYFLVITEQHNFYVKEHN